jgi:hypothetical protein
VPGTTSRGQRKAVGFIGYKSRPAVNESNNHYVNDKQGFQFGAGGFPRGLAAVAGGSSDIMIMHPDGAKELSVTLVAIECEF